MRYLSLFSGIGCFEHAIHAMYPDAICLGYSEIKPEALRVYQHHYPKHRNLGDVTTITESTIRARRVGSGGVWDWQKQFSSGNCEPCDV